MTGGLTKAIQYRAIQEKDKKYDGIFYFGVKTTGLYCRPSCTAFHAKQTVFHFFSTNEQAAAHGYTACKTCHPGRLRNDLSQEILDSIDTGAIDDIGIGGLANSLHISERHLRRIVQARTGASPLHLNQAKRLDNAKQLIQKTELPIIDIAFKVGFSSLRQFNDAFKVTFDISPSMMRKKTAKLINKTGSI